MASSSLTHTLYIHNSNLPSANNRAVCGEKKKGGVEIRQIMVEGMLVFAIATMLVCPMSV